MTHSYPNFFNMMIYVFGESTHEFSGDLTNHYPITNVIEINLLSAVHFAVKFSRTTEYFEE